MSARKSECASLFIIHVVNTKSWQNAGHGNLSKNKKLSFYIGPHVHMQDSAYVHACIDYVYHAS